jgi:hypothetical protein
MGGGNSAMKRRPQIVVFVVDLQGPNSFGDIWQTYRVANPPLTLAFVTSYDSCLDYRSVGGPTVLKFSPCG